ncbi:MAG: hypothetical protein QF464_06210 [Myxococcota bacterium]|jgi:hypothetical protein|nr:hypothetical protein [Myxococcota bacterium]
MSAVLNDEGLAELLQLDMALVVRLLSETDLPRVAIAGNLRFVAKDVLDWLSTQSVLLAPSVTDKAPTADEVETVILPADEDEIPFVSRRALNSLGLGAHDPAQNLARQQVRDGLAALGDALHATLVRLSHDRLHPSPAEADRTSSWRLEAGGAPIEHVTMTWAEGPGLPGFADRPHVALTVSVDAVAFSVKGPSRAQAPTQRSIHDSRTAGALVLMEPEQGPWSITCFYEVSRGAPTAARLQTQLSRDASILVPLWLEAVGEGLGS